MKITNRDGLPDAIVRAVTNDPYTKGYSDYSISDLLSPPRQLVLQTKHWDEIEEDASERVWSLFGQAVHHIAERANIEDVVERRLYWNVAGKVISGAMDNYNPKQGLLTDYKTASVFKFSFSDFTDWEQQQNCYAQLLRWNNEPIYKLQIVAFVKDWRNREAKDAAFRQKPYPKKVMLIELPVWSEYRAIAFIEARIKAHEMAKNALPECSPEERWARPSTWAIKRSGGKAALPGHANYAVQSFAEKALADLGPGYYIEHRPGVNTRCQDYCSAAPFCSQFQNM